jgi:hypothetical protein
MSGPLTRQADDSANVKFYIGAQKRSAPWTQGSPADAMLSAVSVFDSRTANVHVENTAISPISHCHYVSSPASRRLSGREGQAGRRD